MLANKENVHDIVYYVTPVESIYSNKGDVNAIIFYVNYNQTINIVYDS